MPLVSEAFDEELDEGQRLRLVDDVDEKGADYRDYHEGAAAHAVALADGGHVDDRGGRSAEAVAAEASAHDCGVVVLAEDAEYHEVGRADHEEHLADEDEQKPADESREVPER